MSTMLGMARESRKRLIRLAVGDLCPRQTTSIDCFSRNSRDGSLGSIFGRVEVWWKEGVEVGVGEMPFCWSTNQEGAFFTTGSYTLTPQVTVPKWKEQK